MEQTDFLFALCGAQGVSGAEEEAAALAVRLISQYAQVRQDALGNVIGTLGENGPHILLDAHLDQIGLIVTAVDEQGFLKIEKCGGMDVRILAGHEVTVWGREPLYGVISCSPPHLSGAEERKKATEVTALAVDIGMDAQRARELVRPGDRITLRVKPARLLDGCVTMPGLDDRAGVTAILRCLELVRGKRLKCRVTVVFSVQEEVGTRGAGPAAFSIEPDEAVAVDVSFAWTPDSPRHKCGELRKGPMIGIAPALSFDLSGELEQLARREAIPYQMEIMGGESGTNADVIDIAGPGIKTGLVSIPLRYMHTGVEVVSMEDVENTARLLASYLLGKGAGAHA